MNDSAILYANADHSVVLIDLPRSIEVAQKIDGQHPTPRIISCEALESPYPSTEPKKDSKKLSLRALRSPAAREYHESAQRLIRNALNEIQRSYSGPWCLERSCVPKDAQSEATSHLNPLSQSVPYSRQGKMLRAPVILSRSQNNFSDLADLRDALVMNSDDRATQLHASLTLFNIPPCSAFLLSDVVVSSAFFTDIARLFVKGETPCADGLFGIIVADPPWPNRSAKRSSAYATSEYQNIDPFQAITFLFKDHLAKDGLAVVWVTNKEHIRTELIHQFRDDGLELVEEWIWAKVTRTGVPVTDLDGLWRLPYESCLLFRRLQEDDKASGGIKYRVIVAAPDLHSRKPSLKEMLTAMFPDLQVRPTLEVFARNLTTGWWAWGNEVLKYSAHDAWRTAFK